MHGSHPLLVPFLLIWTVIAAGCASDRQGAPLGGADSGLIADADPDRPDADPATCLDVLPFVPTNFAECDIPALGLPIDLAAGEVAAFDTGSSTLMIAGGASITLSTRVIAQPAGPDLLLVSTPDVQIADGARLSIFGPHPVAIVSSDSIGVDGEINAGGRDAFPGPGGDRPVCGLGEPGVTQTASNGAQGGSGGGGGGYGGAGGFGPSVSTALGDSAGGAVNGESSLSPLRGGCSGGRGGHGDGGAGGGVGGGGGGAVQLVAAGGIDIGDSGVVAAPGGGGASAVMEHAAGGGGGSGGAVFLEANRIVIRGAVTANGGGGGEGNRGGIIAVAGEDGALGSDAPAAGGSGGAGNGGDGGAGGAGATPAQPGEQGNNDTRVGASGGGGGGVGRIRLRSVDRALDASGVVSPPAAVD